MAKLKPELSKKNKYWIDKNRYYELKYFCLQYPLWKSAYNTLDGMRISSFDLTGVKASNCTDILGSIMDERTIYQERIQLVENAAREADPYLASYILKAVTEGYAYTYLESMLEIPCSRDTYYDRYRRFFWLLDQAKTSKGDLYL